MGVRIGGLDAMPGFLPEEPMGFGDFAQTASPLLLAMGQNLQTPRAQRDPMAMQRGLAQMGQQQEKRRRKAALDSMYSQMGLEEEDPRRAYLDAFPEAAGEVMGRTLFPEPQQAEGPMSPLGKLEADYRAGRIPKEIYEAEIARRTRTPEGMTVFGPDGNPIMTTGDPSKVKLTEQQSKDLVYYKRASQAAPQLDQLETVLTNWDEDFASRYGGVLGNYYKSAEYQQAEQAAREWLASILRKDTGAAITSQEFDLYGPMYLPQPGDKPEVIAQKKASRRNAVAAIRSGLGPAQILLNDALQGAGGSLENIPTERLQAIYELMEGGT